MQLRLRLSRSAALQCSRPETRQRAVWVYANGSSNSIERCLNDCTRRRYHVTTYSATNGNRRPLHTFYTRTALPAAASSAVSDDENNDLAKQVMNFSESNPTRTLADESACFKRNKNSSANHINNLLLDSNSGIVSLEGKKIVRGNLNERLRALQAQKRYMSKELLQSVDGGLSPDANNFDSLTDFQLWLECDFLQESVLWYEKIINDTCSKHDHSSLTKVQRQLLQWYYSLRNRIQAEQESYLLANKSLCLKDSKRFGPYLCLLPPEKLAVITSHEATMLVLMKGGGNLTTLAEMAFRIGTAVEEEVNVQKLLRERVEKSRKERACYGVDHFGDTEENNNSHSMISNVAVADKANLAVGDIDSDGNFEEEENYAEPLTERMRGESYLRRFNEKTDMTVMGRKRKARVFYANSRARQILETSEEWSTPVKVKIGSALIQFLVDTATVSRALDGVSIVEEPAFKYEKRWVALNKVVGYVTLNQHLYQMIAEDKFHCVAALLSRHQPMIVPPRDWTSPREGGYRALKVDSIRTHGCQVQRDALYKADLSTLFNGLNVLGKVPWAINKEILVAAQRCWSEDVVFDDIPSRIDRHVPPAPIRPRRDSNLSCDDKSSDVNKEPAAEYKSYREAMLKHKWAYQKNMALRSRRYSAILKTNLAEKFNFFDEIYFPYNVDFRGRAYPVPPHLSNMDSDLCRGMLRFSRSKPLGPRGLYWLKVHLANLAGTDKISFDARAEFTDVNMDNVRSAAHDPFGENRWWMTLDDPFQALAVCKEITKAIDSGDSQSYECALPVHMDGSCNNIQHYAALGRNRVDGKAVNLCFADKPQDVYAGVKEKVVRLVAEEASRDIHLHSKSSENLSDTEKNALEANRAAKLLDGLIDRGVVKRTVMTSVYGLTHVGATKQIKEKIEEKLEKNGYDVGELESDIYSACKYLARVTMDVMGDSFTGARQTMNWLTACARLISSQGQPVAWMSPIGLPVVQPYRQVKSHTIVTLIQSVVLTEISEKSPIHKLRQVTAFPPNYVHSLDSSHMLLTALEMDRRGLTFSAVHDSFWTHPCDVDEMNDVLRDCFVKLYDRPLLEDLKKTWELRFPSLEFPDLPKRGNLNLDEVKNSPYFFQ